MKTCTFYKVTKQKGSIKFVQDCGICLNCVDNLWRKRILRRKKEEEQ